jgi:hypothetical protein
VHSGPKYKLCIFHVPKVSEMLRNTRKHHFGSNGLEWMLHNFGAPKYYIQARNMSFSSFTCGGFAKCSEHFQTSFWVQWTRMDVSQLWNPEIFLSGPKHEFFIFYLLRVCEMLWNTPKHQFWVQWARMDASQILVPGNSAFGPEIRVLHLLHAEG